MTNDEKYMKFAIEEGKKAYEIEEVPVGAIIVKDGEIIGRGYNKKETLKDPTAHAEIIAIKEATKALGGWRLIGCTMYVTIEPCPMCAGAIMSARLERLVIGAKDEKMGGCGSVVNVTENDKLNHVVNTTWGILEEECSILMKKFFRELRKRR